MITFDTRGDTPLSVRLARVVVPLLLFFAYLLGRVYPAAGGRIPAGEALVMGVVLIGLAFTGLIALGDLIAPLTPRVRSRLDSEALEITAVHAPVVTDIDAAIDDAREQSWPRNAGTLLQPAVEQMARDLGYGPHDIAEIVAMVAKDRASIEDTAPLHLFTHEYHAQHHTPPRGLAAVSGSPDQFESDVEDWWDRHLDDPRPAGRHHKTKD